MYPIREPMRGVLMAVGRYTKYLKVCLDYIFSMIVVIERDEFA